MIEQNAILTDTCTTGGARTCSLIETVHFGRTITLTVVSYHRRAAVSCA